MRATSVLANAKSKVHQDASSRAAWREGKLMFLPKETCCVRAQQESAEAIVALRRCESTAERRAEGTTAARPGNLGKGPKGVMSLFLSVMVIGHILARWPECRG